VFVRTLSPAYAHGVHNTYIYIYIYIYIKCARKRLRPCHVVAYHNNITRCTRVMYTKGFSKSITSTLIERVRFLPNPNNTSPARIRCFPPSYTVLYFVGDRTFARPTGYTPTRRTRVQRWIQVYISGGRGGGSSPPPWNFVRLSC